MGNVQVTHDADQLAAAVHAAALALADLDAPNTEAGRVVLAAARPPRATGAMAAGTRATAAPHGVTFASTARYWTFVHFGAPRRNLRARPWLAESLEHTRSDVLAVYARHADLTLSKIG